MPDPASDPNPVVIYVQNPSGDAGALAAVNSAITTLNQAFYGMNGDGQLGALSVWSISIDGGAGRSYMDVGNHTFHLNAGEALESSTSYLAASILHDGYHAAQEMVGTAYYGIMAEQNATLVELQNAAALGLSTSEVEFLTNYRSDVDAIQNRIDEPINVFDGTSWELTSEIDWNLWSSDASSWFSASFESWLSAGTDPGYWDLDVSIDWGNNTLENLNFPNLFQGLS